MTTQAMKSTIEFAGVQTASSGKSSVRGSHQKSSVSFSSCMSKNSKTSELPADSGKTIQPKSFKSVEASRQTEAEPSITANSDNVSGDADKQMIKELVDNVSNILENNNLQQKTSDTANDINIMDYYFMDGQLVVNVTDGSDNNAADSKDINIDELLEQIKDFLCDKLDLDKDELDKVMAESGINALSLFQISSIRQIFAAANNINDFSEMLTSEELTGEWNSIMDEYDSMTFEAGDIQLSAEELSKFTEKIKDVIQNISKEQNTTDDSAVLQNADVGEVVDTVKDVQLNDSSSNMFASEQKLEENVRDAHNNSKENVSFNENMFETFISNLQDAVSQTDRFSTQEINQIRDISFQIVEGIKVNVKADTQSLEMQLNPESLGKVNVSIEMKNGIATAHFAVKNEMSRIAIESQVQTLKDAFEQQGIKVEAVEVTVSDFSFENRQQSFENENGSNSKPDRKINKQSIQTQEDDENIEDDTLDDGSINLTA